MCVSSAGTALVYKTKDPYWLTYYSFCSLLIQMGTAQQALLFSYKFADIHWFYHASREGHQVPVRIQFINVYVLIKMHLQVTFDSLHFHMSSRYIIRDIAIDCSGDKQLPLTL